MTSISLSFTDDLTGRRVSLAIVADGKLQSPEELRAQIKRPLRLELIKSEVQFAQRLHRRQEALPPLSLGSIFVEYRASGRVRYMFCCVGFACRRLATASAGMHVWNMTWSWAEVAMERVTRGRVKKVQVRLQRRACCTVRCACLASACVRCVFDACCRKRWLLLKCVAAHRSGCIKRAAAFILVCRLLLPPALQADAVFWTRQNMETAFRCFAILLLMLIASTSETDGNCPPLSSPPQLVSSFACSKLILLLFFSQHTPLHWSAIKGHLEISRLLLQCNADVGATDATSSWWSLGGAGIGRSRECIQSLT
jgi:hypothetical protein